MGISTTFPAGEEAPPLFPSRAPWRRLLLFVGVTAGIVSGVQPADGASKLSDMFWRSLGFGTGREPEGRKSPPTTPTRSAPFCWVVVNATLLHEEKRSFWAFSRAARRESPIRRRRRVFDHQLGFEKPATDDESNERGAAGPSSHSEQMYQRDPTFGSDLVEVFRTTCRLSVSAVQSFRDCLEGAWRGCRGAAVSKMTLQVAEAALETMKNYVPADLAPPTGREDKSPSPKSPRRSPAAEKAFGSAFQFPAASSEASKLLSSVPAVTYFIGCQLPRKRRPIARLTGHGGLPGGFFLVLQWHFSSKMFHRKKCQRAQKREGAHVANGGPHSTRVRGRQSRTGTSSRTNRRILRVACSSTACRPSNSLCHFSELPTSSPFLHFRSTPAACPWRPAK